MFGEEYQIQDSASNTAVVKLWRDASYNVVAWQSMTPRAFAPSILIGEFNDGQEAHRSAVDAHGNMLACDLTYETGETIGVLALWKFYILDTPFSYQQGDGMLFDRGVHGGKLRPGRMTWTKL